MSSTRLPTDVEELLKLAKSDAPEEKIPELTDAAAFLFAFNITPGTFAVTVRVLYSLYRLWSREPITKNSFSLELGKFLPNDGHFYRINRQAFELSEKSLQLLKDRKKPRTKAPVTKKHFDAFLKHYDLKPGTYWLESFVLYYLYDIWVKKSRLSKEQFIQMAKLYFKHKRKSRTTRMMWFAVDESVLRSLPESHLTELREGYKKYNEKTKNKTKRSKTPRPSS